MTVREEVLRAGADRSLVGIASLPGHAPRDTPGDVSSDGPEARAGVVLLNAGLVHRVGPARQWVHIARRLAARGHPALRVDFSGIGDSPDAADSLRFEVRAPQEARAAMDALRDAAGVRRFVLVGLCSGAEIAFKTALVDPRVVAVVLVNAPRFLEEPSAELVARLERRQAARYYWSVALKNPGSWWKALSGRAEVGSMVRALWTRLRGPARDRGAPRESADARAFRELAARGVLIHLVLSEGDWAQDYLEAILGPGAAGGGPPLGIRVAKIAHCDHLLTPLAAQRELLEHVERWAPEWR